MPAAERVDADPTPPATDRPTAIALFLEAGGDTDAFDADRYVGLLRDHGYAAQRVGLVEILQRTATRLRAEATVDDWEALARILTDELGKHGYRIHDVARCVRPPGEPLAIGRPMTPEEEQALVIDAPVRAARPRRRSA
jgi:hypothetical protein